MKVLALVPSFFGHTGDAVNERQLLMALARKVEECYVLTFVGFKQIFTKRRRELKIVLPENMILIPLPLPQIHILIIYFAAIIVSCFISIISLILNVLKKIDLIYIRSSFLSIGFLTFRSLARKTIVKIPAIIEDEIAGGDIIKSLIRKIASFTDRFVLARAGRVAVNGRPLYYELVQRRCFIHEDEPLEIPPGVDLSLIERIKNKVSKDISLGMSKDYYTVGFLGLIAWWQGVDVLVKSVAKLKDASLNKVVKLLLVGDGPERRRIEYLCKRLGVDYEITGFIGHYKALEYLSMFDVLVLPRYRISTTECIIPIKVIEAWALGVPVITTRHEIYKSTGLRNKEDIIFCEPDPDDVAEKILLVLRDGELRKKLSKRGQQLAENFYYDKIVAKLINAFKGAKESIVKLLY